MKLSPDIRRLLLIEFFKHDQKPKEVAEFLKMTHAGVLNHFKKLENAFVAKYPIYTKKPYDILCETGLRNHPEIIEFLSQNTEKGTGC